MFQLTSKDFRRLSTFIQDGYGIKMPDTKITMLQSRLQKRLRLLGMNSFSDYCDMIFSSEQGKNELVHMIDAVTTNKTDFFREPAHYQYLTNTALPDLITRKENRNINVWSAGCSTGEEPYTLAMVLDDYLYNEHYTFSILATDLSSRVLETARMAIYDESKVAPVPYEMKKKYLLKSKDRTSQQVRIVPELRSKVQFKSLNFMDREFRSINTTFDLVFCRNVIIYFERDIQADIIGKQVKFLNPGGYLFLGHSETLFGLDLPLKLVAPTIYKKIR